LDILLDTAGCAIGVLFAFVIVLIIRWIVAAEQKKKEKSVRIDEFGLEIPEGYPNGKGR
jgi:hypothetical protein